MTNSQILTAARNNLNAVSDTLWSDTELLLTLWRVGMELARDTRCMEQSFTTVTVTGTSLYTAPPNATEVWRVTYNGAKLYEMDYREFDSINPNSTASTGTPGYYINYSDRIQLYPAPDAANTLKVWTYEYPESPTASGTITIPAQYHDVLVAGLTYEMAPKDLGHPLTVYWRDKWESAKQRVVAHMARKKRADKFAVVKTEEQMLSNDLGVI